LSILSLNANKFYFLESCFVASDAISPTCSKPTKSGTLSCFEWSEQKYFFMGLKTAIKIYHKKYRENLAKDVWISSTPQIIITLEDVLSPLTGEISKILVTP